MTITLPPRPRTASEGGSTPKTPLAPQGPAALFAPPHLTRPTDILPHSYVLHIHSQRCSSCETVHEWNALYAWNQLKTRMGTGKIVDNLIPVDALLYNIPIKRVRTKQTTIPLCHRCSESVSLAHLPNLEDTEAWKSTAVRRELDAIAARLAASALAHAPPPTLPPAGPKARPLPLTTQQGLDLI